MAARAGSSAPGRVLVGFEAGAGERRRAAAVAAVDGRVVAAVDGRVVAAVDGRVVAGADGRVVGAPAAPWPWSTPGSRPAWPT
jgi:hypothetical protein